jgi:hypothetical protein
MDNESRDSASASESPQVFDAAAMLLEVATRHGIALSVLVAETSLWAHPDAHRFLAEHTAGVAMYPAHRRYRAGQGEKAGQQIESIKLDNNSYANVAIKRALGVHRTMLRGFETCHIWPMTCYDPRYHTAIANLVLLPRALAGLTDHDRHVQSVLQYRAFELYQWSPEGVQRPERPDGYPDGWKPPLPFTPAVASALARRVTLIEKSRSASAPALPDPTSEQAGLILRSQRDLMRDLVRRFGRDVETVMREYAAAEERGEVRRDQNSQSLTSVEYARRLWSDGMNKGWL